MVSTKRIEHISLSLKFGIAQSKIEQGKSGRDLHLVKAWQALAQECHEASEAEVLSLTVIAHILDCGPVI